MNNITTYFGTLEKSELLVPIDISPEIQSLVYESKSPFLGYYDDLPGKHNDVTYLYFAIEGHQNFIALQRVLLQTYKIVNECVDLDHARLHINQNDIYAVRLRSFSDIAQVVEIHKTLSSLGIIFAPKSNKNQSGSRTRITKYFKLREIDEGIWIDEKVEKHGYIQLPKRIELDEFKTLVSKVRNNWEGFSFDAGLAALSTDEKVIETVRIYTKHITDEAHLKDLKKVFLSVL